jgi:hypothetical protein
MSNTSTDSFEYIAEDTMDLLITAIGALTAPEEKERQLAKLLLSLEASSICKRAIALTA